MTTDPAEAPAARRGPFDYTADWLTSRVLPDHEGEPADGPGAVLARTFAAACAKVAEVTRERDQARAVLAELVRLKDGPRGAEYDIAKPAAWERARALLNP